jgi:hypothetical protein
MTKIKMAVFRQALCPKILHIENTVSGFLCYYKYSIGADLRKLSCGRDTIEKLKVVIRICKEVMAFRSFTAFQTAAEAALDLGRQSKGWIKIAKQKVTPPILPLG